MDARKSTLSQPDRARPKQSSHTECTLKKEYSILLERFTNINTWSKKDLTCPNGMQTLGRTSATHPQQNVRRTFGRHTSLRHCVMAELAAGPSGRSGRVIEEISSKQQIKLACILGDEFVL